MATAGQTTSAVVWIAFLFFANIYFAFFVFCKCSFCLFFILQIFILPFFILQFWQFYSLTHGYCQESHLKDGQLVVGGRGAKEDFGGRETKADWPKFSAPASALQVPQPQIHSPQILPSLLFWDFYKRISHLEMFSTQSRRRESLGLKTRELCFSRFFSPCFYSERIDSPCYCPCTRT